MTTPKYRGSGAYSDDDVGFQLRWVDRPKLPLGGRAEATQGLLCPPTAELAVTISNVGAFFLFTN